jgi:putative ABC transport system ATP-binding protein
MYLEEMLELRDVSKSYREGDRRRVVFERLDAAFAHGQLVAITGRSGSGKSTMLNLISGIDLPDAGSIVLDGIDLTRLGDRERTLARRHKIGFVFQFFNLIPTLSVMENLLLPLELVGRRGARARGWASDLLERVGLAERASSFPESLSGGEQQRVAVVRALVHDPLLVLADEPTGNLDAETGRMVLELLDEMVRARGRTLLMVTHSDEAARFADRVWRIERGVLAVSGATP